MGLDTTHDAWHGPYSMFNNWRGFIASKVGIPLWLMEGFYGDISAGGRDPFLSLKDASQRSGKPLSSEFVTILDSLPIKWESLREQPLIPLLDHSDCDGRITCGQARRIAAALGAILLDMKPEDKWYQQTKQFMQGCQMANEAGEDIYFH